MNKLILSGMAVLCSFQISNGCYRLFNKTVMPSIKLPYKVMSAMTSNARRNYSDTPSWMPQRKVKPKRSYHGAWITGGMIAAGYYCYTHPNVVRNALNQVDNFIKENVQWKAKAVKLKEFLENSEDVRRASDFVKRALPEATFIDSKGIKWERVSCGTGVKWYPLQAVCEVIFIHSTPGKHTLIIKIARRDENLLKHKDKYAPCIGFYDRYEQLIKTKENAKVFMNFFEENKIFIPNYLKETILNSMDTSDDLSLSFKDDKTGKWHRDFTFHRGGDFAYKRAFVSEVYVSSQFDEMHLQMPLIPSDLKKDLLKNGFRVDKDLDNIVWTSSKDARWLLEIYEKHGAISSECKEDIIHHINSKK